MSLDKYKMNIRIAKSIRWMGKNVTVEPLLACYYVATTISNIVVQNLTLFKSCWPDAPPPTMVEVCPDEAAAQALVASIASWKTYVLNLLPIGAILVAGPWSDRHCRRRPLIFIPLIGQIVAHILVALCVVWWKEIRPEILAICETLPAAVSGGLGVLGIGVTSYLTDITTVTERTVRMGIMTACVFIGSPIGAALAGVCNRYLGFLGANLLCVGINSLGLIYAIFRLKEPKQQEASNSFELKAALRLLLQPKVLIISSLTLFVLGPIEGEYSVLYLYLRYKFHWTEVDFSLYAAFKMVMIFGGTLLTVFILCKLLKLTDSMIGLLSCLMQTIASCLYLSVNVGWQLYLVPIAELLHGASFAVQKSIASKIVPPSDIGKLYSLTSLSQSLVPLIVIPLYNQVYQYTFTEVPAAFFVLSALLTLPALLTFSWLYFESRRENRQKLVNSQSSIMEFCPQVTSITEEIGTKNNSALNLRLAK